MPANMALNDEWAKSSNSITITGNGTTLPNYWATPSTNTGTNIEIQLLKMQIRNMEAQIMELQNKLKAVDKLLSDEFFKQVFLDGKD